MRYSTEEKAMWVEDWRKSGKSAWGYALANGLIPQTFLRWVKPKNESSQLLVEVPPQVIGMSRFEQEILIEKGEIKIHIPVEPVLGELHGIIKALGQTL